MKLLVEAPASRRELLRMLCVVPEDVRRFALEHVLFVSVGGEPGPGIPYSIAGCALPRARFDHAQWIVPLVDRSGIGVTAAHELAHAIRGDVGGSAEGERGAAELARSWIGCRGESTDPDGCAARFVAAADRMARMRPAVADGQLEVACSACGSGCTILAPTVPGLEAHVGVSCDGCGWCALMELAQLVRCPDCGGRPGATWADGATPEMPQAALTCACSWAGTYTLRTDPPPVPAPVPAAFDDSDAAELRWLQRNAAGQLMRTEEDLRRGEPDLPSCGWAIERVRSLLLRAVALLPADPRGPLLLDLDGDVAAAADLLDGGELAAAADALAAVAGALNALGSEPPVA